MLSPHLKVTNSLNTDVKGSPIDLFHGELSENIQARDSEFHDRPTSASLWCDSD